MRRNPDLKYCMTLPPQRAIAYLKNKGYALSDDWEDVWQEAHDKAFTVAKVTRLDVLQDIRNILQEALDEGKTGRWFEKELTPLLQKKGWWGKKETVDPETGEIERVQLGSPWRLQTIYRTNLQTAYMAGRYAGQMENVDDRPYWMYVAVMDDCTRPEHAALNGKVFPYDDPFWDAFYPPNGWGCRCRVVPVTADYVARSGIRISSSSGSLGSRLQTISQKSGEMRKVATFSTVDPVTRRRVTISPDAGWSYIPGKTWRPDTDHYNGELAALAKRELE